VKLDDIISELQDLDDREKLEFLVEFSNQLPPLSPERAALEHPQDCRVQECQTAVYLWVEVKEGRVQLEADVPRQSPTVRGLVALLVEGLNGEPADAVLELPEDLLPELGLVEALGMQRRQGLGGVIRRIQRDVRAAGSRN